MQNDDLDMGIAMHINKEREEDRREGTSPKTSSPHPEQVLQMAVGPRDVCLACLDFEGCWVGLPACQQTF